jgi:BirA family biotin operon repressor/biotin-[acetyl-CoA-carboxylase] ligase
MLKFGKQVFKLNSVDSTNNYAANLLKDGIIENGAVVMADFQTNGRGQRSNAWHSDSGMNLCASFVYLPANLALSDLITINWWVSLSVIDLLNKFSVKASIKWPNDIFAENLKVGGLLIETVNQGAQVKSIIIGVGINVNQLDFNTIQATSIKKINGIHNSVEDVLWSLCDSLTSNVPLLSQRDMLKSSYEALLFRVGVKQEFLIAEQAVFGEIQGVGSLGQLKVRIDNQDQLFDHGQIKFII